jgi:hypothetical protein
MRLRGSSFLCGLPSIERGSNTMKRILALALAAALLLLGCATAFAAETHYPNGIPCKITEPFEHAEALTIARRLNFRAGPGLSYPILRILPRETELTILEFDGLWAKVIVNGQSSWVHSDYLRVYTLFTTDWAPQATESAWAGSGVASKVLPKPTPTPAAPPAITEPLDADEVKTVLTAFLTENPEYVNAAQEAYDALLLAQSDPAATMLEKTQKLVAALGAISALEAAAKAELSGYELEDGVEDQVNDILYVVEHELLQNLP